MSSITETLAQKLSGQIDETGVLHLNRSSFIAGAGVFKASGIAKPVNSLHSAKGTVLKMRMTRPFSEFLIFVHGEKMDDDAINLIWSANA